MSDTYTKLFSSLTASTIVSEPLATRWLWVTMLAMADARGAVYAAIPGLARIANITLPETEEALRCFLAPDAYSRTQDNDGRRIERIDGGWRLLNHGKYSAIRSAEERRDYMREYMARKRAKDKEEPADVLAKQLTVLAKSTEVTPPALDPTPTLQEQEQKALVQPAAARGRFAEFWLTYPNKKSRQEAEKAWKRLRLDDRCDELIAHVALMTATDSDWLRGYVPMGSTYLNQARWEDVPKRPPITGAATPSKTFTAMQKMQGIKHGLAGNRAAERPHEVALLGSGSNPGE